MTRFWLIALAMLLSAGPALAQPTESFAAFIRGFEAEAVAAGISSDVYRDAMAGLTPDPDTPRLVTTQPEFTTPVWEYIDTRVTQSRIARGQAAMGRNSQLFERIGRQTGVDPYLLGAIWGIETDYGTVLDNRRLIRPIIRSLATLVHQRRTRYLEDKADLIAALTLLQWGPLTRETLIGSWAGAIGHLQVNPSNVVRFGTDGDADGRIDLHGSLADALATSAAFLRGLGYRPGEDWGFEVELPEGFDYLLADRETFRTVGFFAERGVTRVAGRRFGDLGQEVFLYVPTGRNGPKFLMTRNYLVIKGYNFSDSYALAVAHLTDRLKGSGPLATDWPRATRFPNLEQRIAIQTDLKRLGFYDGVVDGRLGPISQAAYARFQARTGRVADGFITAESYEALRRAR
ncbi:membrane-bound lytic murein transglycosylase B [Devosia enhydra]|uniref:Membrane-bound lytic murein transglycosylase B n=1 Tax=Devosia enhydra TaxID=665118 RepID=A0A1K2I346_9HYPH|nr:lytic murein transglycosylase [Devosia enhydra]SFZ86643.1 membrane-bound lytic murein transglycosylase B [Devosia enhydra]